MHVLKKQMNALKGQNWRTTNTFDRSDTNYSGIKKRVHVTTTLKYAELSQQRRICLLEDLAANQ